MRTCRTFFVAGILRSVTNQKSNYMYNQADIKFISKIKYTRARSRYTHTAQAVRPNSKIIGSLHSSLTPLGVFFEFTM